MTPFFTLMTTLYDLLFTEPGDGRAPAHPPADEQAWLDSWPRHRLPASGLSFAYPPTMAINATIGASVSFVELGPLGDGLLVLSLEPGPADDWSNPENALRKIRKFAQPDGIDYEFLASGEIASPAVGTWLASCYGANGKMLEIGFVTALAPRRPAALLVQYQRFGTTDVRDDGVYVVTAVVRSLAAD